MFAELKPWHDQGNESDVANIDFELFIRLKEVTDSNVLLCLEIHKFAHIFGTRFRIVTGGLDQNVGFEMDK